MTELSKSKALEAVIRPIVEGQIRGFLKEHPGLVEAVDWYKPRKDKMQTLINSLSKRIVRDLTCGTTAARLEASLLGTSTDRGPEKTVHGNVALWRRVAGLANILVRPRQKSEQPIV